MHGDGSPDIVDAGALTVFSIFVHNTGDVALADVAVTDELFPNCSSLLPVLAPRHR